MYMKQHFRTIHMHVNGHKHRENRKPTRVVVTHHDHTRHVYSALFSGLALRLLNPKMVKHAKQSSEPGETLRLGLASRLGFSLLYV